VNVSSRETSKPGRVVCPVCGSGELRFRGPALLWFRSPALVECDSCGHNVDEAVLRVLEQIVALPEAIGDHACGCGHPKMRKLPDGVFHCPACGSEVLPFKAFLRRSPAPEAPAPQSAA
jgi:ribosomal protein L37AE/L43A